MLVKPEIIIESEKRIRGEARNEDPIYRVIREALDWPRN
jgi:hypothetical protein